MNRVQRNMLSKGTKAVIADTDSVAMLCCPLDQKHLAIIVVMLWKGHDDNMRVVNAHKLRAAQTASAVSGSYFALLCYDNALNL